MLALGLSRYTRIFGAPNTEARRIRIHIRGSKNRILTNTYLGKNPPFFLFFFTQKAWWCLPNTRSRRPHCDRSRPRHRVAYDIWVFSYNQIQLPVIIINPAHLTVHHCCSIIMVISTRRVHKDETIWSQKNHHKLYVQRLITPWNKWNVVLRRDPLQNAQYYGCEMKRTKCISFDVSQCDLSMARVTFVSDL